MRKGILLAGGRSTRLYPLTSMASKQLLPVYDKPMIYYPLSTLLLAGIRDILIITSPGEQAVVQAALGDGSALGIQLAYEIQAEPRGIAQSFRIGRNFLGAGPSALILGDNIFYGHGLTHLLESSMGRISGATIFGYHVRNPGAYGVISFDDRGRACRIEEKPSEPASNYAIPGLYFYDENVVDYAQRIVPSARGELEISDINRLYLEAGTLHVEIMGRGYAWLDMGDPISLLDAANFVRTTEERQGLKISCPEEIAWRKGLIDDDQLAHLAYPLRKCGYGRYLLGLLERDD